ncbi:hypothetical protein UCH007_01110 [Dehalococcoides sp. UCH007]|nr:hypothetical protein UCH007_01110 [Dehalococcoides sp. UCH007]
MCLKVRLPGSKLGQHFRQPYFPFKIVIGKYALTNGRGIGKKTNLLFGWGFQPWTVAEYLQPAVLYGK